ncbi:LysR substrate-binding domain-containing protein [Alsobacter sp. KACC 23698]|uniref:LysR substrate-binding domain-containing protein n=1 Tax=Alsobacter sp. KACC 23698 TaxID=3149229 RepID=A0AAU7JFE0_9HYPH
MLQEELVFVSRPGVQTGPAITLASALLHTLAMPEEPGTLRVAIAAAARGIGADLKVAHDVRSISAMKMLAVRGTASCILPMAAVSEEVAVGTLDARPIVMPSVRRTLYLASAAQRPELRSCASFPTICGGRLKSVSAMRARVGSQPGSDAALNATHRARFLLSGLLLRRRLHGHSQGSLRLRRAPPEGRLRQRPHHHPPGDRDPVLAGLKERLLAPDFVAAFMTAMQGELTKERQRRLAGAGQRAKTLAEIDRRIAGMLRAIEDGLYEPSMKDRMAALRAEREAHLAAGDPDPDVQLDILLHPRLPELYRRKVETLEAVHDGPDRAEAMDVIRSMIKKG